MIKRSAKVLDGVDPDAQVMSGGMFATPQSDGAIVSYDFLKDLYDQGGVDDAIDVVGVHPYGPDVDAVTSQVEDTRKALDDAGTDAPMWITEIGWGSDPKSGNDLSKTPAEQAQLLMDSFTDALRHREAWGAGRSRLVHVARRRYERRRIVRLVRDRRARRCRSGQQGVVDRLHRSDRRNSLDGSG